MRAQYCCTFIIILLYSSECLTLLAAGSLRFGPTTLPMAATAESKPQKTREDDEGGGTGSGYAAAEGISLDAAVEATL